LRVLGPDPRSRRLVAATLFLLLPPVSAAFSQQDPSPAYSGPRAPVRATTSCKISKISDGDTITCAKIGRVRLIGIDTPERDQKPYGSMAASALAAIMPKGSTVDLELDVEKRDRYDRLLAYVWWKGRLVNWEMVWQGWAVTLTYPPNVQYVEWFRKAEEVARREKRGLWKIDGFGCLPYDHRHGGC
jgi:micrococcal nuclease